MATWAQRFEMLQKPIPLGPSAPTTRRQSLRQSNNTPVWASWDVLDVRLIKLHPNVTTYDLYRAFQVEGHIDFIEIYVNRQGLRDGTARIRFKPPPKRDFITSLNGTLPRNYAIELFESRRICYAWVVLDRNQRQTFNVKSPVKKGVLYPESLCLDGQGIEFGTLESPSHMLVLSNHLPKENARTQFSINLRRKLVYLQFTALAAGHMSEYRICIAMEQLEKIVRVQDTSEKGKCYLVISLKTPPQFHRRYTNIMETHQPDGNSWREDDRWYRQTGIEATREDQETRNILPIDLKQSRGVIKMGRWTTYRLKFSTDQVNEKEELITNMLQDHNIPICQVDDFKFSEHTHALWDYIDNQSSPTRQQQGKSLAELVTEPQGPIYSLSFPVRYYLEVCVSNNIINEYTIAEEFLKQLVALTEEEATRLLEYIIDKKLKFYDPLEIFQLWKPKLPTRKLKLPHNCYLMRSVVVTPTTIIVKEPTVEVTNRVIRQYQHHIDRFLRVRFEDDEFRGDCRIHATDSGTMDEVFTRVLRTLTSGIKIGDRRYEFLAYGNSQLRDHGAYFFAPTHTITSASIRAWMGSFDHEKIIAKHAARIGQCFSTTKAVRGASVEPVKKQHLIRDIERNGYTFTDGVGKISPFLANLVAMELGITTHAGGPPSVFQFRLSGCKGVLTVTSKDDKSIKWNGLALRKSQFKFDTEHHGLEIIRHSEFWGACLNRQIILVLSTLGVEDKIFLDRQKDEIKGLEVALDEDATAISMLHEFVDPNHAVMVISQLVADGFRRSNDPFVTSLLRLWRAWRTKDLKEKAKLKVKQGACLLGCIDETATLRGHFDANQPSEDASYEDRVKALPEIFVQVSRLDSPGTLDVIEGVCILARNPSLHPGDIRVVRAVDVPKLHHLKDVVVLPQTGDRDLSSMCSGGDLDGDDYIVIWDQRYIPKIWNQAPMDYTAPPPKKVATSVTPNDIMRFFVQYMKNDFLGRIARAHIAWADYLDDGLRSDKCLELAALHSKAVDYPKTGQPAKMDRSLKPRSWPHFLEHKSDKMYKSEKILGRLYDGVKKIAFVPNYDGQFDDRILSAFETGQEMFDDALELKELYDEHISRIMALHEIKTEFEVFSTLCLGHSQATKDYKFHEDLGQLSSSLKQQFKNECVKRAGGSDYEHLAPYAVAMYKVTEAQLKMALRECQEGKRQKNPGSMPFISFPWVLQSTISELLSRQRQGQSHLFKQTNASQQPQDEKGKDDKETISRAAVGKMEDDNTETKSIEVDSNVSLGQDQLEPESRIEDKLAQDSTITNGTNNKGTTTSHPAYEESESVEDIFRGLQEAFENTKGVAENTGTLVTPEARDSSVLIQFDSGDDHDDSHHHIVSSQSSWPMSSSPVKDLLTDVELSPKSVSQNLLPRSPFDQCLIPQPHSISAEFRQLKPPKLSISSPRSSTSGLSNGFNSPELMTPSRRRRAFGARRSSAGTPTADIEALLEQSDRLVKERIQSRQTSISSKHIMEDPQLPTPIPKDMQTQASYHMSAADTVGSDPNTTSTTSQDLSPTSPAALGLSTIFENLPATAPKPFFNDKLEQDENDENKPPASEPEPEPTEEEELGEFRPSQSRRQPTALERLAALLGKPLTP